MTNGEWIGLGIGAAIGAFILRDLLKVKPDVTVQPGTLTGDGSFTQQGLADYEASKTCMCGPSDEMYACPCDEMADQLPLGALGGLAAAAGTDGVL